MRWLWIVGCVLIGGVGDSWGRAAPGRDHGGWWAALPSAAMAAAIRHAPSIEALHAAVERAGLLDRADVRHWRRRVRRAAWLPRLQVGMRRTLFDTVDLRLSDEVSVSGGGVVVGPQSSQYTQQGDRNWYFDLRAQWDLPALLASPDEAVVSRERRAWERERRTLLTEANRWRQEWIVWEAAALAQAGGHVAPVTAAQILAQQQHATAMLDALSAGWFSHAIAPAQGDRTGRGEGP